MSENYFNELSGTPIKKEWIEERQGFKYMSWAFAQEILGDKHPDAIIEVKEYGEDSFPYLQTPLGYFVQVTVEINGVKRGRPFPVTDSANRTLGGTYWKKINNHPEKGEWVMNRDPNAFDINTAIQRAFVKACAEHGIGLYIYQGEDLPASFKDGRKSEILTTFAQWRSESDKTDNWFVTKETLLGQNMEEWDIDTLETYHQNLTELRAKAVANQKKPKQDEEAATTDAGDGEDKPQEESAQADEREVKTEVIRSLAKEYEEVKTLVKEYMEKLKKASYDKLTDNQLNTLHSMVLRREQTALKERAKNEQTSE